MFSVFFFFYLTLHVFFEYGRQKRIFFECLVILWALLSGSKIGTGTAVFVEDFSGSFVYKKFFFPATNSLKKNSRNNFSLCSENGSNSLDKWFMVEKTKRATCIEHKKTFSFVKLLHWLNIFETLKKKKNSCMELNILRSKTVSQITTFFLLLFGQH